MSAIWNWIKSHPYMSAGLAAAVILLIYLMRRNSAAAASTTSAASSGVAGTGLSESGYLTLQEANLQASQNLQAVQLQAGVQTGAQQTALQTAQFADATQLSVAQLQAQVSLQQIQSTASSTDNATNAQLQAALAQTSAGVQTAGIGATEAVDIAGLQTQVQLAQIAATQSANNVIAQLAGVISGHPVTLAPPPPAPQTVTVVPTVPVAQPAPGTSTITAPQPTVASPIPATAGVGAALIPYNSLTTDQWDQLIALETNQPLASITATYSAMIPGGTITQLQQTVGAHSTAGSAYSMYQAGALINTNPGSPYSFAYGPAYTQASFVGGVINNPWALNQPMAPTGSPHIVSAPVAS